MVDLGKLAAPLCAFIARDRGCWDSKRFCSVAAAAVVLVESGTVRVGRERIQVGHNSSKLL